MSRKTALVALGFTALALVAAKSLLPTYVTSPRQARERVLRQDFRMMNAVITQYTLDKQLATIHSTTSCSRISQGRT